MTTNKIVDMNLWRGLDFTQLGDTGCTLTAQSLGYPALLKNLFSQNLKTPIFEFNREGSVKEMSYQENSQVKSCHQEFYQYFINLGGQVIHKTLHCHDNNNDYIFVWNDGIAELLFNYNYLTVTVLSYNEELIKQIKSYFEPRWKIAEKRGHVYAIVKSGTNLALNSVGDAGAPLTQENYTPKVIEDYKYVVRDLNSETPSGRIAIIKGEPGTGKTRMIRSLLLEVADAMFVLVSPDVIKNLAGPELLPLLMTYRANTTGPIILVLEDADKCLVSRDEGEDNLSSIQALLNLGDGILGSLLDIRIIATTNAEDFEMDPAILRKGRLSKLMTVSKLDLNVAKNIFQRLLPNTPLPEQLTSKSIFNSQSLQITLAEVYDLARCHGWEDKPRNTKSQETIDDDNN